MRDVTTVRKVQKLVRLLSVRDSFKVFVRLKVQGDDYVRTPTANSFYLKKHKCHLRSGKLPVLGLVSNGLHLV